MIDAGISVNMIIPVPKLLSLSELITGTRRDVFVGGFSLESYPAVLLHNVRPTPLRFMYFFFLYSLVSRRE